MNTIPKGCRPFNLQECIEGKPVVTRDGRPYKFGAYNAYAIDGYRLIGWGEEIPLCHHDNGELANGYESEEDLFMKAETKTVYTAVYKNAHGKIFATYVAYDSVKKLKETLGNFSHKPEIIKIHETEVEI